MDLSKLPRLSKTDPVPGAVGPAEEAVPKRGAFCDKCGANLRPNARFCDACGNAMRGGAVRSAGADDYDDIGGPGLEVWISVALGILLILIQPRIWKYYLFRSSFDWTFVDAAGAPLAYTKTVFFWGDLTLAAFSVALILEGAALLFSRRPLVVLLAFGVTAAATLANLVYVVAVFGQYGPQLMNIIAVIFGVVIATFEWHLLRSLYHRQTA